MQIKEAKVYNFGKLEKREFSFAPGINVIYGENEAGKSTLHTFLTAMLFGMEKGRGRGTKNDYQRYEPWHAPAYYSGAIRFVVEERPFYLERNFYHKEKRELLRNEADGEELSVAYGDLSMLLGGIDKETFGNTYDIPQSGAVTGKELTGMLAEYLADAAEGGDRLIRVTRAQEILLEKKRTLSAELKNRQIEKQKRRQLLLVEQEILERDCANLRENIEKANEQMLYEESQHFSADMPKEESDRPDQEEVWEPAASEMEALSAEESGSGNQRLIALLGGAIAVLALAAMWFCWRNEGAAGGFGTSFWVRQGLFAVLLAGGGFIAGKSLRRQKTKTVLPVKKEARAVTESVSSEEKAIPIQESGQENTQAISSQAAQMFAMLKESLDEKETRLYNLHETVEELGGTDERDRELIQDIEALELAADEIIKLARGFCEDMEDSLNEEISRYISAITCGRYDSVRVDEKGNLHVQAEGKEISPEALSRGTLEQFYLALRLAVGNVVMKEEKLPIFLDETFSMYDDRRLAQTLAVLAQMDRQILIFTCQHREMEMLDRLGISYHRVVMSDRR